MSPFEQYHPKVEDEEPPELMDDSPLGQCCGQNEPEGHGDGQIGRRPLMEMASQATMNLERLALHGFPFITIIFDRGRMSAVIDSTRLLQSQKLHSALQNSQTRTLHLRHDFPYGVKAMLDFIATGTYTIDATMSGRYPLVTMLDLHVHAYLASIKYDVPALSTHAINAFLAMATCIIRLDFVSDNLDAYSRFFDVQYDVGSGANHRLPVIYEEDVASSQHVEWAQRAPYLPTDGSGAAHIDRFLNAIVLLWKNTAGTGPLDSMRGIVVQIVKQGLGKLMQLKFFVYMLKTLDSFGDEVVKGLQDDGLVVTVVEHNWVGPRAVGVRFEAGRVM